MGDCFHMDTRSPDLHVHLQFSFLSTSVCMVVAVYEAMSIHMWCPLAQVPHGGFMWQP